MKKLMQVFCTACILDLGTVNLSLLPSVVYWRGVLAEELRQNNASFHARCRKRLVNSAMLKCAKARFEKAAASQNTSFLSHPPGRPSLASHTGCYFPSAFHGLTKQTSRRIPRSSAASFNKKLCFFCQSNDDK